MRALEQIDLTLPFEITPMVQDLDAPMIGPVDGLDVIKLSGADTELFISWVKAHWRAELERDLQSISNDREGRALLSTWMPLVTFRTNLCGGGRQLQDDVMQELMERLRSQTRNWRLAGCDLVDLSGRIA